MSNPKWEERFPLDLLDFCRLDSSLQAHRKATDSVRMFMFPQGVATG